MPVYKDEERGTWNCQFYYKDWTDKRKRHHKRGFRTKKEAQIYEAEFKYAAKGSMDMKLSNFVEVYFKDKNGELKERSLRNKRYMMETHIIPCFGEKAMNKITPGDIIQWQNEMLAKDYSQTYLRMVQNQITALFNHAYKVYGLADNPCTRVRKIGKSDANKMDFWTKDEYESYIQTVDFDSYYYVLFEILFWTGCRVGEVLALTPKDIDIAGSRIHISKTYFRMNGEDVITAPKTENSNRTIDIPQFLLKEIEEYMKRIYQLKENDRLFPITARAVQLYMKRHIQKANVKHIRVHDLRHSHVAYLINQGVEPLLIKERLGHRDIQITLNTYGHLYPNRQKKLAEMLNERK